MLSTKHEPERIIGGLSKWSLALLPQAGPLGECPLGQFQRLFLQILGWYFHCLLSIRYRNNLRILR